MKRYFEALRPVELPVAISSVPDGLFLVRIARAQYRWHRRNPYYDIRFAVLKPKHLTGSFITGRLECNRKAMWKVSWFLREFSYDPELLCLVVRSTSRPWWGSGGGSELATLSSGALRSVRSSPFRRFLDERTGRTWVQSRGVPDFSSLQGGDWITSAEDDD